MGVRAVLALALLASAPRVALAQATGDGRAAQPANAGGSTGSGSARSDQLAPTQLQRGPSMYETGRVGKMTVQESGVQIRQTSGRAQPREQRIDPRAAPPAPAPKAAGGSIVDPAAFERDLQPRFARLRACKVEVARQRHLAPEAVAGSRLTLRWTILPDGHVAETRVVAVARVNGHLADCLKREMSLWAFDPPRGGAVTVERPFRF